MSLERIVQTVTREFKTSVRFVADLEALGQYYIIIIIIIIIIMTVMLALSSPRTLSLHVDLHQQVPIMAR